MELLYRGAEAEIWKSEWLGIPCVIKKRVRKTYRHPALDERIIKTRIRNEARMLILARQKINTPHVLDMRGDELVLEWIEGEKVRDILYRNENTHELGYEMGRVVKSLHENGIIHNDLTTSNFIYDGEDLWLIDFGLATRSKRLEDMATDLVVFKRMMKASHWDVFDDVWPAFLRGYKAEDRIIKKIGEIERRAKYMR